MLLEKVTLKVVLPMRIAPSVSKAKDTHGKRAKDHHVRQYHVRKTWILLTKLPEDRKEKEPPNPAFLMHSDYSLKFSQQFFEAHRAESKNH